jgi:predicted RNase H-like HicB family nuclease
VQYTVVLEQTPNNWSAYVPDLPGCITTGATRADVERLIREAIALYVESLLTHGDPVPAPGSWTLAVDIPIGPVDALAAKTASIGCED